MRAVGQVKVRAVPAKAPDRRPGGSPSGSVEPPEVELFEDLDFAARPMKLALVAGVHPDTDNQDWTLVARNATPTRVLMGARLYPFTEAGSAAASEDANGLHARLGGDDSWTTFKARVLVEGPWGRPEAVTPVWVIEGLFAPISVAYYFD